MAHKRNEKNTPEKNHRGYIFKVYPTPEQEQQLLEQCSMVADLKAKSEATKNLSGATKLMATDVRARMVECCNKTKEKTDT